MTIEKNVKSLAKILDEMYPKWEDKIDNNNLAMHSIDRCILSQIYGKYSIGRDILIKKLNIDHGDYIEWYADYFSESVYRNAWIDEINNRRNKNKMDNYTETEKQLIEDFRKGNFKFEPKNEYTFHFNWFMNKDTLKNIPGAKYIHYAVCKALYDGSSIGETSHSEPIEVTIKFKV